MNKTPIELGSEVEDTVTGYRGIAVARSVFLAGCVRVEVQAPVDKDGKVPDGRWFDEALLSEVAPSNQEPQPVTGGPRREAKRAPDAVR
ncbi:MAG: hypothetical protein KGL39_27965 [Patescibacteria group bacterium]|nr:hypothetical protein [Patescibacteria group bacterium]